MFEVQFKKSVEKDLKAFPKADQKRTLEQIGKVLAKNPYLGKALSGEGQPTLRLTSAHAQTGQSQRALRGLRTFCTDCRATAEQIGGCPLAQDAESHVCGGSTRKAPSSPTVVPTSNIMPQSEQGRST